MRSWSNLGWSDTPFGADKRPWPRTVYLIAATATEWVDDGHRAVPVAAGLVYLPVRRHGSRRVDAATLHVGYRAAVVETADEAPAIVALVDGHLVQARRHAAAVAAHRWMDDAAALRQVADGRTPGITAVAEAWESPGPPERGTAPLVETCPDLDMSLARAGGRQGLVVQEGVGGVLHLTEVQDLYDQMLPPVGNPLPGDDPDTATQALACSALYQALVVALLAGRHLDRLAWQPPLEVSQVVSAVAWDAFAGVLGEPATAAPPAG
jgi:hypothetical protein